MKNKILYTINVIVGLILLWNVMILDNATTYTPYYISFPCVFYFLLFAIANREIEKC